MSQEVVIANRLRDGRTVYLGDGGWTEHLVGAEVADSETAGQALLARAKASVACNEVVDPYLIGVVIENGTRLPARWRERIRARGPTVKCDFTFAARDPGPLRIGK
jgi:hypothetical protein